MQQVMQVLTSHNSEEWYTPSKYVEMVRSVLGGIDLDPASSEIANRTVRASTYYTFDGLNQKWFGKVFCNPPYGKTAGKSNQSVWSGRITDAYRNGEIESGILLVNSTLGYKWFEGLWRGHPCCLARERIKFIRPDGSDEGEAKRGQAFVYFGADVGKFTEIFQSIGRVILP